jgi:hypothetical protein
LKKIVGLLIAFSLFAQEDECCPQEHVGGNGIYICEAKVKGHRHSKGGGHLTFNKVNAFTSLIVPISEKTFFIPRVEWNRIDFDWNKNPKFNEHIFNYMQFSLVFHTTALEDWRWIIRAEYNQDLDHFSDPRRYGLFSGLFWGKTKIFCDWHYHVGAFGYVGMDGSTIYPIIGFDYTYKKWLFEAVFPITYQVQYSFDEHWKLAVVGRPLKERFRTDSQQPQPRSIFNYSSFGSELNLKYVIFLRLDAEAFAGYNWGGNFYIKNKHGKKPLYEDVEGAFYGGFSLNIGI